LDGEATKMGIFGIVLARIEENSFFWRKEIKEIF